MESAVCEKWFDNQPLPINHKNSPTIFGTVICFPLTFSLDSVILVFTSYQEPKEGGMMKHLWRLLTGRCTSCGQKLKSKQTVTERVSEINNKAGLLATSFGRRPQVQSCEKCDRIVFEGEQGFVQSLLLIDLE